MQGNKSKTYSIVLLIILLIATAGFIYVRMQKTKSPQPVSKSTSPIDITPLLVSKLQQLVKDGSDGLYQLSVGQLEPDVVASKVTIINAKLIPDTAALRRLDALQKAPDDVFTISFDSLRITGASLDNFIHKKDISLDTIFINKPFIQVAHADRPYNAAQRRKDSSLTLYQKIKQQFNSIVIAAIVVKEGRFVFTHFSQQKKTTELNNVNIAINDVKVDSSTQYDANRFLFSKKASFTCRNYVARTPDSLYLFKIGSLVVQADKHLLTAKDVSLDPRGNKEEFERKLRTRNDMFTVHFPNIICENVDWWALANNSRFYADEVTMQNGLVNDYFNRALPSGPSGRKDNFPQQLIMRMSSKINIQKLNIQNLKVAYEEYNPENKQTGSLAFTNITGTVANVTNENTTIKTHPLTVCSAKGLFMNQVPVTASIKYNLSKMHSGAFSSQLHIGAVANTLINPIAESLGMFTLQKGNIKEATVQVTGDNKEARVKMLMLYDDLKIFPLKKQSDSTRVKKKALIGFFANTFVIKDANPVGKNAPRNPEVTAQRGDSGSFFNFLWKAILTGIVKTIGLPKKFANQ